MKLADQTYICNSLTYFEYEGHAMIGNGNYGLGHLHCFADTRVLMPVTN